MILWEKINDDAQDYYTYLSELFLGYSIDNEWEGFSAIPGI